jgi:hypothetical protein
MWSGERDQERPEMVHEDVLHAVQEELVLRHVVEARLHHGVDGGDTQQERRLAPQRRVGLRRGAHDATDVSPQAQAGSSVG